MGGNLLTVQSLTHTHSNDEIFHGSDKMPKHVEMVQTKCQPKIGTDKMPTTIKSPDKMQTFGWYFVRLAFCPHTIEREGLRLAPQKNSVQRSRLQMIGLRKKVCREGDSRGMEA